MYVTLALAIVQSLAVAMYLPLKTGLNPGLVIAVNTMIMVAGAFFLVWLSDLNAALGLGSSVVIMMAGMVMYLPEDVMKTLSNINNIPEIAYIVGVIALLIFVFVAVLVEYSKYQIPVNKLGIHNNLKSYTFLDIKLNPAGGMPFMYAMTLVSIPQYAMLLILSMDSNAKWAAQLAKRLVMGDPIWILLYILMIALLSFAFAFVNVSGQQIADRMKQSGDYIYGVYPGEDTSRFINRLVLRFALIGAVFNVTLAGLPILFVLKDESLLKVSMIPGLFLILSGMLFTIHDELQALRLNERYRPLF